LFYILNQEEEEEEEENTSLSFLISTLIITIKQSNTNGVGFSGNTSHTPQLLSE
jgi:hypothetical protein